MFNEVVSSRLHVLLVEPDYYTRYPPLGLLKIAALHKFRGDTVELVRGLIEEAEGLLPDYDLIPQWNSSILFASRGCIRRCGFCSVPKLEGRPSALKYTIKHLVYPGHPKTERCCERKHHTRVILWDNNILGNNNWRELFSELAG